jgi:hypothetical protein
MRQCATASSENDEDCVCAGTMCNSNLMCECVVARCMIGMGEKEIVRVVVVRSDKLIRLIRSGRGRRDTRCSNIRYWVYGGVNQSINQSIWHKIYSRSLPGPITC